MESNRQLIESLQIQVKRDDAKSTERLHVTVILSVFIANPIIKSFSKEDIYNLKVEDHHDELLNLLKLNVFVQVKNDIIILQKPVTKTATFKINREEVDFNFNDQDAFLLVVEAKLFDIRPEGTKRKVITYEDTDVIDDTK